MAAATLSVRPVGPAAPSVSIARVVVRGNVDEPGQTASIKLKLFNLEEIFAQQCVPLPNVSHWVNKKQ